MLEKSTARIFSVNKIVLNANKIKEEEGRLNYFVRSTNNGISKRKVVQGVEKIKIIGSLNYFVRSTNNGISKRKVVQSVIGRLNY